MPKGLGRLISFRLEVSLSPSSLSQYVLKESCLQLLTVSSCSLTSLNSYCIYNRDSKVNQWFLQVETMTLTSYASIANSIIEGTNLWHAKIAANQKVCYTYRGTFRNYLEGFGSLLPRFPTSFGFFRSVFFCRWQGAFASSGVASKLCTLGVNRLLKTAGESGVCDILPESCTP